MSLHRTADIAVRKFPEQGFSTILGSTQRLTILSTGGVSLKKSNNNATIQSVIPVYPGMNRRQNPNLMLTFGLPRTYGDTPDNQ